MLGSVSEADDAVQEAWLRLSRADTDGVETSAAGSRPSSRRVCLDMLRARRARREDYVGSWLPEPIVSLDDETNPEQEALLADSVGLALLVVLDTLTPAERLAFVLHDMFGVPFEEIAPIVGRTPAADPSAREPRPPARARRHAEPDADLARAARGRRRVPRRVAGRRLRGAPRRARPRRRLPDRRAAASAPRARPAVDRRPSGGASAARAGPPFARFARPALVNGAAGLVVAPGSRPISVVGFTVADGRIVAIDIIADPHKLDGLVARRLNRRLPARAAQLRGPRVGSGVGGLVRSVRRRGGRGRPRRRFRCRRCCRPWERPRRPWRSARSCRRCRSRPRGGSRPR